MATGVELYESVYLITGRPPILVIYFKYRVKRWMTVTSTLNHRFRMLGKKWYCYLTQVGLLIAQESNTERQILGKRKDSFIEKAGNPREKADSCPRDSSPHCNQGATVFKGGIQEFTGRGLHV